MMLVFLTMFGFFFVVSQLFQLVLGYGSFESGLRMLPIMPVMIIFAPVPPASSSVSVRARSSTAGMLLTAAGVFILSFLERHRRATATCSLGMFVMAIRHGPDDDAR